MPTFIDLTGHVYRRLLVISRAPNRGRRTVWNCRCECGKELTVQAECLRGGNTSSCGCLKMDAMRAQKYGLKHGHAGNDKVSPEYRSWHGAKDRCCNPRARHFPNYGGRGIVMCDRWRKSFEAFLEDMGRRPTLDHSLDRIEVNGPYSPENCRWATYDVQQSNRRDTHRIVVNGRLIPLSEAMAFTAPGVDHDMLYARITRGWTVEQALNSPPDLGYTRRSEALRRRHAANGGRRLGA